MVDLNIETLSTDQVATLASAALAELARRAGGAAAAPVQLALLPEPEPIDPTTIDLGQLLADGRRRWLLVKEATGYIPLGEDALIKRARKGAGFQLGGIGGKWYIDMSLFPGRA